MSVGKIAAATTLLGGAATGAALLTKGSGSNSVSNFVNNTILDSMSEWKPLSEDTPETPDLYKDKYAEKYKRYLVGVGTAVDGKDPKNNDAWWDWSFKNRYSSSNGSEGFDKSKITKWEELKHACKSAYKGTKKETENEIKEGGVKYKEDEIWKYCSPAGTKIKTIAEVSKEKSNPHIYSGKIGGKYKDSLVSSAKENNWFWNLKQQELKEYNGTLNGNDFEKLKKTLSNGSVDTYAKVENVCVSIYGKVENEITNIKDDLFRFCSLTGEVPKTAK